MERIVVGVDGSQAARQALQWAVDEARRRNATVEAIYAWHQPFATGYAYMGEADIGHFEQEAQGVLDAAVDTIDASGITVERKLMPGGAASTLVEEAKGATLLVVGSRGRGGFSGHARFRQSAGGSPRPLPDRHHPAGYVSSSVLPSPIRRTGTLADSATSTAVLPNSALEAPAPRVPMTSRS